MPATYTSLQVLSPARNTYASGVVAFQDGDANPIPGIPNQALDGTGSTSLTGLHLNTANGLPQFLITLNGSSAQPHSVSVKLTWTATYDPSCVAPGTTVSGVGVNGLMMLGGDGGMFGFGGRNFVGPANFGGTPGPLTTPKGEVIPTPFTAIAATPGTSGYWAVLGNGQVFTVGSAVNYGGLAAVHLAKPIVGMVGTPDGKGYWLVGADGGVFRFGDAAFYGSLPAVQVTPTAPIVAILATLDGKGYTLIGSDGGVFTFGDAGFYGSTGGIHLAAPVSGAVTTSDGRGYLLVAKDGGVFRFGDAHFYGSVAGTRLNAPVIAIALDNTGGGYWLVGSDGGVFTEGNAPFQGSLPATGVHLRAPIVGAVN
jgi:hypothetical protein